MDEVQEWIIQNIKNIRISKGWDQKKLSEQSGLTRSQLSLLETGKQQPSITLLVRIAKALNIEVGELFLNPDVEKRQFEDKVHQLKNLPEKEKSAIETMIDMAIQKNREKER